MSSNMNLFDAENPEIARKARIVMGISVFLFVLVLASSIVR